MKALSLFAGTEMEINNDAGRIRKADNLHVSTVKVGPDYVVSGT